MSQSTEEYNMDEQVGTRRRRVPSESESEQGTEPSDGESLGGMEEDMADAAEEGEDDPNEELPYGIEYDVSNEGRHRVRQGHYEPRRGRILDRLLAEEERIHGRDYAGDVVRPPIEHVRAAVAARTPWSCDIPADPCLTVSGIDSPPPGFRFRTVPRVNVPVTAPIDAPGPGEDERVVDEDQFEAVSPAYSTAHVGSSRGFRRFVATLNNPSYTEFQEVLGKLKSAVWAVVGLEVGEGGTPHLQFTGRFKDAKTRSAWSKVFPHCWIAACRGTEEHCEKYCKKGQCFVEVNRANYSPGQGARMDLEAAAVAVRDRGHAGLLDVVSQAPQTFVRFHGGLSALAKMTASKRSLSVKPTVHWYIGVSGSGKSTAAEAACRAAYPDEPVYHLNVASYKWISAYKGEKVIMIHDWRGINGMGQKIPMIFWLGMWDRFAFDFEEKGGMVPCMAHTFYVSSIHHPNSGVEYEDTPREPLIQLLRRVTHVYECARVGPLGSEDPAHYVQQYIGAGTDQWPRPFFQPPVVPAI